MTLWLARGLAFGRKVLLVAAGGGAVVLPVVVECLNAHLSPAQSRPAAPRQEFEVASIKPNKSGDLAIGLGPIGEGRFRTTNISLRELITMAYRIRDDQLHGAPGWLSERYDVIAKAGSKAGPEDLTAMLQPLLEDRLHLEFHRETRELPIYSLAVTKPGKLIEAEGECGPPLSAPPDLRTLPHGPCGFLFILPGYIVGQKVAISRLADALSRSADRIVVDKTGLTGKYDINLEYTPEPAHLVGHGPVAPPGLPPLPPIDPNGPALFTALQEQLGLKLESQKGPVAIMVVDHVERPSGN